MQLGKCKYLINQYRCESKPFVAIFSQFLLVSGNEFFIHLGYKLH